jgi:hypothetical protein
MIPLLFLSFLMFPPDGFLQARKKPPEFHFLLKRLTSPYREAPAFIRIEGLIPKNPLVRGRLCGVVWFITKCIKKQTAI